MNEDCKPVGIDNYGGLCTLMERSDLPVGLSPACRNVEFFPGGVQTRNGTSFVTYAGGGPAPGPIVPVGLITGIAEHLRIDGTRHIIFLDVNGGLWDLNPASTGTLTRIEYDLGVVSRMKAVSIFGRIYMAFHDGKHGITHVRQYDGTNLDTVAPQGPCAAFAINTNPGANTTVGKMTPGVHDVVMVFETRSGYLTQCTTAISFTAIVDKPMVFLPGQNPIPVGPPNVIRRRLYMSAVRVDPAVAQTEFYTLPSLWIENNSPDSENFLVGAPDVELINGTPLGNIPLRQPIPPALGVEAYNKRLFAYGCLSETPRIVDTAAQTSLGQDNTNFDSGLAKVIAGVSVIPGWTIYSTKASIETGVPGASGACLTFTTDGSATLGPVTNAKSLISSAVTGALPPGSYNARVRLKLSASTGETASAIEIGNGSVRHFAVSLYNLSTYWQWCAGNIIVSGDSLSSLSLSVVNATLATSGVKVYCDAIEMYPTNSPYAGSLVYVSDPEDPEVFDAETGMIQISPDDGQEIRASFQLRGNLYFAKERSLWVTSDNGDVPTSWRVDQVSDVVGTFSADGIGVGEGWVVIASRAGLYMFDGGIPQKISQEIQPLWDRINWNYGETIFVTVFHEEKKIYIGVPMPLPLPWETHDADDAPTVANPYRPNLFLVLDYVEGFGDPIQGRGQGRKWSVTEYGNYATDMMSSAVVEWSDRRPRLLVGAMSHLAFDDPAARVDTIWTSQVTAGQVVTIYNYYETAPVGADMGRSLFSILAAKVRGAGTFVSHFVRPNDTIVGLADVTLAATPLHDVELKINQTDTQLCFRVGAESVLAPSVGGAAQEILVKGWFVLKRLAVWLKNAPFSNLRGHNL